MMIPSLFDLAAAALQRAYELRGESLLPEVPVPTPLDQHADADNVFSPSWKRQRSIAAGCRIKAAAFSGGSAAVEAQE